MSKTIEKNHIFLKGDISTTITIKATLSDTCDMVVVWEIEPQNSIIHKQSFTNKKGAANFLTRIFGEPQFCGDRWENILTDKLHNLLEKEQLRINQIEHPTKLKNFTKELEELLNKYGARFEIDYNEYPTLNVNFQDGCSYEDMISDIAREIPSTL